MIKKSLGILRFDYSLIPDLPGLLVTNSFASSSFSPDILSRSILFGSGRSSTVSTSPSADNPASMRNSPDSPMDDPRIITQRKFLLTLIGTAGSWFLMDWALYGNSIMSSQMLSVLVPSSTLSYDFSYLPFALMLFMMGFGMGMFVAPAVARAVVNEPGRSLVRNMRTMLKNMPMLAVCPVFCRVILIPDATPLRRLPYCQDQFVPFFHKVP